VRTAPHDPETAATMRQWDAEPGAGPALVAGLAERYPVIAADHEGHRMAPGRDTTLGLPPSPQPCSPPRTPPARTPPARTGSPATATWAWTT
jgi:hypothetical protein